MTKVQKGDIMFMLVVTFIVTFVSGCGQPHVRTIKELMDTSNYSNIYVANAEVSSKEQTDVAKGLNQKFSKFATDEMVRALKQKSAYAVVGNISPAPKTLVAETTIDIAYGSRALRYWVGFGAGSGSITVNTKLKDSLSSEIKLEMETRGNLSVGAFGGSMEAVIMDSIKEGISKFVAKL